MLLTRQGSNKTLLANKSCSTTEGQKVPNSSRLSSARVYLDQFPAPINHREVTIQQSTSAPVLRRPRTGGY
jgi:hypothetical protein